MMARMLVPLVLVCLTFFNGGCTAAQRTEWFNEVKEYVKTNVLPEAEAKAKALVEAKLKEKEDQKKAELDLALAEFKQADGSIKTWKDFDEDKDGSLSPKELAAVGLWVAKERAKGGGTSQAAGSVATVLITLGGLWLAKKGVGGLAKKVGDPAIPGPKV